MPSRTTDQITCTLASLLPSYALPDLPTPLISLTQSFLQRSRSRAPNLRNGEEEAARVWCVAEMACQRLKGRLNLPRIESRPPCAPKVYRKLYAFMDGVVGDSAGTPGKNGAGTSGKSRAKTGTAEMPLRMSGSVTPMKRAIATNPTPTTTPQGAKRRRTIQEDLESPVTSDKGSEKRQADEATHDWIVPSIRQLCKACHMPAATPHVYVGVRTILDSYSASSHASKLPATSVSKKRAIQREHPLTNGASPTIAAGKILALIVTVLLAVLDRMGAFAHPATTTDEEMEGKREETRRKAIDELVELKKLSAKQLKCIASDVEDLAESAEEQHWWSSEWLKNVPTAQASADEEGQQEEDVDELAGIHRLASQQRRSVSGGLVRGCLMQNRFNWLSDERKGDFEKWKTGILRRIEEEME